MKITLTIVASLIVGFGIGYFFSEWTFSNIQKDINKENQKYLTEKQQMRTSKDSAISLLRESQKELQTCKQNYTAVATEYFDSKDEYQVK